MGILDGIVEWIAEQVMNILDLITTSVLGALGCSMDTFLRYFPAAETMYQIFLALAIGLILLNWVWQLFKNYFMGTGIDAEDPIKLSLRTFMFLFLTFYAKDIVDLLLDIAGTPYGWILTEDLPPLEFGSFNSVITVILGVCQRRCCYRCPDFSANPCLELHQASFRGCRTLHLTGSSNLYCTSRLCNRCVSGNRKHI